MMAMMNDTCNNCDEVFDADEMSLLHICPNCWHMTTICANCRWHTNYECGESCPFTDIVEQYNREVDAIGGVSKSIEEGEDG